MRISDGSSDVCSSDLRLGFHDRREDDDPECWQARTAERLFGSADAHHARLLVVGRGQPADARRDRDRGAGAADPRPGRYRRAVRDRAPPRQKTAFSRCADVDDKGRRTPPVARPRYRADASGGRGCDRRLMLPLFITAAALQAVSRSEEHTSELQSLTRTSYAGLRLKKKKHNKTTPTDVNK